MVKGEIGGRLKTIDIAGRNYECGGSIIHPKNILMKKLVEEMGLSPTDGMNYLRSQLFNTLEYGIHVVLRLLIFGFTGCLVNVVQKFWRHRWYLYGQRPYQRGYVY